MAHNNRQYVFTRQPLASFPVTHVVLSQHSWTRSSSRCTGWYIPESRPLQRTAQLLFDAKLSSSGGRPVTVETYWTISEECVTPVSLKRARSMTTVASKYESIDISSATLSDVCKDHIAAAQITELRRLKLKLDNAFVIVDLHEQWWSKIAEALGYVHPVSPTVLIEDLREGRKGREQHEHLARLSITDRTDQTETTRLQHELQHVKGLYQSLHNKFRTQLHLTERLQRRIDDLTRRYATYPNCVDHRSAFLVDGILAEDNEGDPHDPDNPVNHTLN